MIHFIDISEIKKASGRINSYVKRTELLYNDTLSKVLDTNVWVKLENFQKTGSFKVRGAFNKLLDLSDEQKRGGVVTVSGGNHAQAIAYACNSLKIDSIIVMPESTPQNYVEATQSYGAKIDFQPSIGEAFGKIEDYQAKGMTFAHPFDDPLVMAGQGTIGLEILEDLPEVTDIFVSIGGGGLFGGVATAIKAVKPKVKIWGVETVGADSMSQAIELGHPVELPAITSIAKTLGAPKVSHRTLALAQKYLEEVILVSDREAIQSLLFILERLKVLAEPAASCTLAAALRLKKHFDSNNNIVLIFCGGNISFNDLCRFKDTIA